MIAYLDASVVLRLVLGEEHRLGGWEQVETAVASALTEVECLRTLDRLARTGRLSPDELAERRGATYQLLAAMYRAPCCDARPSPSPPPSGHWTLFIYRQRCSGARLLEVL